jgi:hypothetical protein
MSKHSDTSEQRLSGWTTDTQLVREFDRPTNVSDVVFLTVSDAIETWADLSETPPLLHYVDAEKLDGLFKTEATDGSGWLPSAAFEFQGCRVTVLYGSTIRVIVDHEP